MKEIREKKDKISGITLIALVITIVILIILAGISANLTLGENGILMKTKEAKIMSAIGSITDQIHLDAIQKKIDNIEMSAELLVEEGNAKRRVQQKDDGKYYMYYCIDISKYNGTSGLGKNENSDLKDVFIIDDELNIKYISKDNKEYGNETSEKILEDETKIKFSNEKFRKYIVKKIGTAQGDITFGLMKTQTDLKEVNSKSLVIYFSWVGSTQNIAKEIQKQTNSDIFEIVPEVAYSDDYDTVVDDVKKEQQEKSRPKIKNKIENIDEYETIYVGYPNWWGEMPMILYTFFEDYDLSNKTITLFCTSGESGLSDTEKTIQVLEPSAPMVKGLYVSKSASKEATGDVKEWVNEIK